jgi:hypothetical protein
MKETCTKVVAEDVGEFCFTYEFSLQICMEMPQITSIGFTS